MKELTLKEIQQESLKILIDVHRFCEENGIRYSLAYGTMIGAVRHKGFIPWDNDIDIYMPRPDYERFCHLYKSDIYGIISEYDPHCYINYCHVYDRVKTVFLSDYFTGDSTDGGVWIDVFPQDGAPDDHDEFEAKMLRMRKEYKKTSFLRKAAKGFINIKKAFGWNWREFCILFFYRYFMPTKKVLKHICKKLRKEAQAIPFGSTGRWTDYSRIFIGDDNFHQIEDWDTIVDIEFEGRQFKILSNYDRILRRRYGDYMKLPPESERVSMGHPLFYWK